MTISDGLHNSLLEKRVLDCFDLQSYEFAWLRSRGRWQVL